MLLDTWLMLGSVKACWWTCDSYLALQQGTSQMTWKRTAAVAQGLVDGAVIHVSHMFVSAAVCSTCLGSWRCQLHPFCTDCFRLCGYIDLHRAIVAGSQGLGNTR